MLQFKRLAIALYFGDDSICSVCQHKYIDVDDLIKRDPVLVCNADKEKKQERQFACKECYKTP